MEKSTTMMEFIVRQLLEVGNFTSVPQVDHPARDPTLFVALRVNEESDNGGNDVTPATLLGISISVVAVACMCWMLKPRPVDIESSWLRRRARQQEPTESPEERMARINMALAVQVVTATDGKGKHLTLGQATAPNSPTTVVPTITSNGTAEEDGGACCCICLEAYEIGDEVAWNKRQLDRCQHVFHKDCILEWLDRHNDCPSCRVPIVVDAEKEHDEDTGENLAFAIVHGLLARVRKTLHDVSHSKSAKKAKPEIFRRVTSLGTSQTWERLPSNDSRDDLRCSARAQLLRRVVSDGLSTPSSSSRRRDYLRPEVDGGNQSEDDEVDVELGHLQVLRHSVSWKRDILENYADEDVSEEDEIIHKIL